jgi:glycosyltransferase involved in cell wall biosynthesis
MIAARADAVLVASDEQASWWSDHLAGRTDVPLIKVPFGIPDTDPGAESDVIPGVPTGWAVLLWWGGVWPWLDLDTLLAARARLESTRVSVVVPTAPRPNGDVHMTTADLERTAARHGLQQPAVVPLERWVPYAERHRILNAGSILAVLHRPGLETELSFRTRALDGLWSGVPVLLSEGGVVSRVANTGGWGAVVPPGDPKLAAAAIDLLLGVRSQDRCRAALANDRDTWRWSTITQPLVDALPELPASTRQALMPAVFRAATVLAGRTLEGAS